MPLRTTVIGSWPKPDYLTQPDWFRTNQRDYSPTILTNFMDSQDQAELSHLQEKALKDTIEKQIELGLDIITDGEICRENYIFHFCRRLSGFDFNKLSKQVLRCGAVESEVPTISGMIEYTLNDGFSWLCEEWKKAQCLSSVPVKYTLPGPLTIAGTSYNAHYGSTRELCADLVPVIQQAVQALEAAGCQHIQIDEPLLVRKPEDALDFAIDGIAKCFAGIKENVYKGVHLCCGYPTYLDQEGYMKADKSVYMHLADKLNTCGVDFVSIEDAHRQNDLDLFKKFTKVDVVLGVVKIASSQVETVEYIRSRLMDILKVLPPRRLVLAPDCGLGFLPHHILEQKIRNMVQVARSLP